MSLPGNGTVMATHREREELFHRAAELIVDNAFRYYRDGDTSVLPRSIATKESFCNAMSLDIAMGGSTNTVLHLLAVAYEAGVDFKMSDIDKLSRRVPVLCKVAPNCHYHVQDVNRAGGIMGILGELDRAGLIDRNAKHVAAASLGELIDRYDIMRNGGDEALRKIYLAAPGGRFSIEMGSQANYYDSLDLDRKAGCIRSVENAYSRDGGLAVLFGNVARKGCIVKTAGVDASILHFEGTVRVYDSQEKAADGILSGEVKAGDVVVIRYEGPKGGPGMQEMLYPTSYLKSVHLDKQCALLTDGRFSGGTSGLSIGHVSPEAAAGGEIGLLENGDRIVIDIPSRQIEVQLDENTLAERRAAKLAAGGFRPDRDRNVSRALRAYASMVASADLGGVRVVE